MVSDGSTGDVRTSLTIREAAVLSRVTEKVIRHELAARVLRPSRRRRRHVELGPSAVFYMSLVSRLPVELSKTDRRDLFALISTERTRSGHWSREDDRLVLHGGVPVVVPTAEVARETRERLRVFLAGKDRLRADPDVLGGEPVFAGTRVSVRHVGELARKGAELETLLADFPALSDGDIRFARIYVELGRPPGRPRKLRLVRS